MLAEVGMGGGEGVRGPSSLSRTWDTTHSADSADTGRSSSAMRKPGTYLKDRKSSPSLRNKKKDFLFTILIFIDYWHSYPCSELCSIFLFIA
jgi:hypothetical protein